MPDGRRTGLDPAVSLLQQYDGASLHALVGQTLATAAPPDEDPQDDVALVAVHRLGKEIRKLGN